jgi:pyridoxal phosphate enzyme (YggS family)
MSSSVAQNLCRVLQNIAACSGNRKVTLVSVSKTKPTPMIVECYNASQRHFGENYVQELVDKARELPSDIQWHFIGHLQGNKVKTLCNVPNLYMVQSVDREKIAHTLNTEIQRHSRRLKVLVQVNTSKETRKSGCQVDEALQLCKYIMDQCPNLEFCGLMTIGDPTNSKSTANYNPDFEKLLAVRDNICNELKLDKDKLEISMGMSSDYELAVCNYFLFLLFITDTTREHRSSMEPLLFELAQRYLEKGIIASIELMLDSQLEK